METGEFWKPAGPLACCLCSGEELRKTRQKAETNAWICPLSPALHIHTHRPLHNTHPPPSLTHVRPVKGATLSELSKVTDIQHVQDPLNEPASERPYNYALQEVGEGVVV